MNMGTEAIQEKDLFRSADMPLAATINLFIPLWGLDRQNPDRVQFLFKREEGLIGLIEGYWSGSLQVPPQAYFQSLKAIKARLYGDTRQ